MRCQFKRVSLLCRYRAHENDVRADRAVYSVHVTNLIVLHTRKILLKTLLTQFNVHSNMCDLVLHWNRSSCILESKSIQVRKRRKKLQQQQLCNGSEMRNFIEKIEQQQTLSILSTFVYFRHFSLNFKCSSSHTSSVRLYTLWVFDVILKLTHKHTHRHTYIYGLCIWCMWCLNENVERLRCSKSERCTIYAIL